MKSRAKKPQSFKREILICLIILSLLPTLISDTVLIQVVKTAVDNADKRKTQEQAELINERFSEYMEELDKAALQIVNDNMINTGVNTDSKWKMNQVYVSLYEKSVGLRNYADFYIYNEKGECKYTTTSVMDLSSLPTYWGILKDAGDSDGAVLRNVAKTGREDSVLFQLGRRIKNKSGVLCGYLVIDVSKEQLEAYLGNTISLQYGIIIMDKFWEEIYSSELASGEHLVDALRQRRMEGVQLSQKSDEMMLSISSLEELEIYTAVAVPKVFKQDIEVLVFLVILIISVVSLVFCFLIAESMSCDLSLPIRNLSEAMNLVKEGNLDIQVEETGKDELGQLSGDFNHMVKRLKSNVEMQMKQQEQINEANIAMMQAQLNPHFLYNTLDTMKWIAKANHIQELVTLSSGLAKILRMSISPEHFVSLSQELKMVESYVDIQKIRFKDKFTCDIEIPMGLEEQIVPKLIIQPIVENAIIHGLRECEEGSIFINIFKKEEDLWIEVSDNGRGIDEDVAKQINTRRLEEQKGHIGIRNVDAILSLYYGEKYGVFVERIAEGGTKVTLRLPCKGKEYVEGFNC